MLNIAAIMGRLVADPELKHTPNDVAVCSFTLAVDRAYAKPGMERQADFINIVAWRNTAEFVCKYFTKGQMMAVNGAIQTRTYTNSDGNKRKAFEIVADAVSFCGDKKKDSPPGGGAPNSDRLSSEAPDYGQKMGYAQGKIEDFMEVTDEDLPFDQGGCSGHKKVEPCNRFLHSKKRASSCHKLAATLAAVKSAAMGRLVGGGAINMVFYHRRAYA